MREALVTTILLNANVYDKLQSDAEACATLRALVGHGLARMIATPMVTFALWPRESIARDTGLARSPDSPTELTLGHNVRTREKVDALMAQAARAGARVIKAASATFWGGYAGYFQDPDGHLWEVAWNPHSFRQTERHDA